MILSCADSRADPAQIFDARPGEIFVVRNVANLVPPYQPDGHLHGVSAALEFGVKVLNVSRIVVMGHAHCGGVNAMLNGAPDSCRDFVAPWVAQATPVVRIVCESFPAEPGRGKTGGRAGERPTRARARRPGAPDARARIPPGARSLPRRFPARPTPLRR